MRLTDPRQSWIFRYPNGHAFGLSDVRFPVTSEAAAWRSMYDTAAERKAARDSGVTCTRQPWVEYNAQGVYDCLAWKCEHSRDGVAA